MRIVKLDEASMKNILADMLKRDPNNYDAYTELLFSFCLLAKSSLEYALRLSASTSTLY